MRGITSVQTWWVEQPNKGLIVVRVNGSDANVAAFERAVQEAKRYGARILS